MIFNAYQEAKRFYKNREDKKRVDVYRNGERVFRFYDYAAADYIIANYRQSFSDDEYTIFIFAIGGELLAKG